MVRKNTSNEQNVCMYNMLNYQIPVRDLLFHYEKILLFWFLFSGKSVEIHYQYMAHANDVNNTESQ